MNGVADEALETMSTHGAKTSEGGGLGPGMLYTAIGEYDLGGYETAWVTTVQDWEDTRDSPDILVVARLDVEATADGFLATQSEFNLNAGGILTRDYSNPTVDRELVALDLNGNRVKGSSVAISGLFATRNRNLNMMQANRKQRRVAAKAAKSLAETQAEIAAEVRAILSRCTQERRVLKEDYNWITS